MGADCIICGAPTWNTGADDMRSGTDIDDWLYSELPNADLSGKKVALFGLGDSAGYSGNFCDSVGELYDCFTVRGATVVGFTDQGGYYHYDSRPSATTSSAASCATSRTRWTRARTARRPG